MEGKLIIIQTEEPLEIGCLVKSLAHEVQGKPCYTIIENKHELIGLEIVEIGWKKCIPIVVSETEEPVSGDYIYEPDQTDINVAGKDYQYNNLDYKIIGLPMHMGPKFIQEIVLGNINVGDTVNTEELC